MGGQHRHLSHHRGHQLKEIKNAVTIANSVLKIGLLTNSNSEINRYFPGNIRISHLHIFVANTAFVLWPFASSSASLNAICYAMLQITHLSRNIIQSVEIWSVG